MVVQTKASGTAVSNSNQMVRGILWAEQDPTNRSYILNVYSSIESVPAEVLNTARNARNRGIDVWVVEVDALGNYTLLP